MVGVREYSSKEYFFVLVKQPHTLPISSCKLRLILEKKTPLPNVSIVAQ